MYERQKLELSLDNARENLALDFALYPNLENNEGIEACLQSYGRSFLEEHLSRVNDVLCSEEGNNPPFLDAKTYIVWGIDLLQKEPFKFLESILEKQNAVDVSLLEDSSELFDYRIFERNVNERYGFYVDNYAKASLDSDFLSEFDEEIHYLLLDATCEILGNLHMLSSSHHSE